MTIDMLIGGLIILMMVAVIVVTMTSAQSDSNGGDGINISHYMKRLSDKLR